jgi:alkylation response protein AidB-like acyl-CoA dehydrogenase
MLCERALSRCSHGGRLAEKQFVQGYIADSYAQLTQFRLLVLHTARTGNRVRRLIRNNRAWNKSIMVLTMAIRGRPADGRRHCG